MSKPSARGAAETSKPTPGRQRSLTPLVLVLLVTLAPVVAALVLYFNPGLITTESTNYGLILEPQIPVPPPADLTLTTLDGQAYDLQSEKGYWLMLTVDAAACPESCARKLYIMRQTHASTGKNVTRIKRVWLITDDAPVPQQVLDAYPGMEMVRADADQLQEFLGPVELDRHIWFVDPLNHLMMRFPEDPDPIKLRKDLGKLLFASQIG